MRNAVSISEEREINAIQREERKGREILPHSYLCKLFSLLDYVLYCFCLYFVTERSDNIKSHK